MTDIDWLGKIQEAVLREREACAQVADDFMRKTSPPYAVVDLSPEHAASMDIAAAIRARGGVPPALVVCQVCGRTVPRFCSEQVLCSECENNQLRGDALLQKRLDQLAAREADPLAAWRDKEKAMLTSGQAAYRRRCEIQGERHPDLERYRKEWDLLSNDLKEAWDSIAEAAIKASDPQPVKSKANPVDDNPLVGFDEVVQQQLARLKAHPFVVDAKVTRATRIPSQPKVVSAWFFDVETKAIGDIRFATSSFSMSMDDLQCWTPDRVKLWMVARCEQAANALIALLDKAMSSDPQPVEVEKKADG